VRRFESTYRSKSQQAAVSIDERVTRMERMHADMAPMTVQSVKVDEGGRVSCVARSANGQFVRMEFIASPDDADRIDGVMLEIGGDGAEPASLSADQISAIVAEAAERLESSYVFPDVGLAMAKHVREKLEAGGYNEFADEGRLARQLTTDLRSISHDLHLGVRVIGPAPTGEPERREPSTMLRELAADNYGFRDVRVLPGNIGYLKFDAFVPGPEAEATAAGAMAFLRGCEALVFDLRANGGGSPEMIRFLTSYLFEKPTHLNDMVDREGDVVQEFWTHAEVPGERPAAGVPVFVLTSSRSFSGAEEFSYNLKSLGRGTIVGERTGGGAHPVRMERIGERLGLGVPFMRARNPITKTNWEGKGVEPDVSVPAAEALDRAVDLARTAIRERRG
jgi:hypothetical protein